MTASSVRFAEAFARVQHARLKASTADALLQLEYARIALRNLPLQQKHCAAEGFQYGVGVVAAIDTVIEHLGDIRNQILGDGRQGPADQAEDVAQCHESSPSLGVSASSLGVGEGAARGHRPPSVTSGCTCGGAS